MQTFEDTRPFNGGEFSMRNVRRMLSLAAFVVVLAATTVLYAQEPHGPSGSMMRGAMMGIGNMMGRGMSSMIVHCAGMMQGSGRERPNEQWRNGAPTNRQ
jgi:hypothetical protein